MELQVNIFSSRRERDELYIFTFEDTGLSVRLAIMKTGAASVNTENGLEWKNPKLIDIMANEGVSAPHNLDYLLEQLWYNWTQGRFATTDDLQTELNALASYMSDCTRARPTTDYWVQYFNITL